MLTNDSVQKIITSKGIDTYMTVSVRGYDKRFKLAENSDNLDLALNNCKENKRARITIRDIVLIVKNDIDLSFLVNTLSQ